MQEKLMIPYNLKECFSRNNIKGLLLDLDDMILDTHVVFDRWMKIFVYSVVDKNPLLDSREALGKLIEFNNDLFKTHFVRQDKFPLVSRLLDSHFNTGNLFYNHRDFLEHIYNISPKMLPGAKKMLDDLKETDLPMGLVTHAGKRWTNLKLEENDLRKYFSHIEIVNPGRAKGVQDWKNGAKGIGILPEYILGFGDNIKGDILPILSMGAKYAVWVKSKWSLYNEGIVPQGVIKAKNTSEVVDLLLSSLNSKSFSQTTF